MLLLSRSARLLFSLCEIVFLILSTTAWATPLQPASAAYKLQFPKDHGSHPEFQTEWWYFTGQLYDASSKQFLDPASFGFQLTFFRRALADKVSTDELNHGFLAHAAISDLKHAKFSFEKRYQRGGFYAAHAASGKLDVSLGDWSAEQSADGVITLKYKLNNKALVILARPTQTPMLQGENGFSKKGSCATCASIYYSMPRLELEATMQEGKRYTKLHGLGWMDHEFMSSALQSDQEGWDWFSVMLKDGRSIMSFQLRDQTGKVNYADAAIFDGTTRRHITDLKIEPLAYFTNSRAVRYPSAWKFQSASNKLDLKLQTIIPNQELSDDKLSYYEGAIESSDRDAIGYVELTGYDQALKGSF